MKKQALEDVVRLIFGDAKTRDQFLSSPDSVLSKFAVTESEKKAILGTYSRFGLVTSGSPQLTAVLESADPWSQ